MRSAYIFIALTISVLNTLIAQEKQEPPAGGQPKEFKIPAKVSKTLPNGLKVTTVQYGSIPKVTISLIIKTGNVHETPEQTWLADLTGNMIKEGTAQMNSAQLAKRAAEMGGSLDVSVGPNQTTIGGDVLSEYAADYIQLLSDVATKPAFPASELDRLKANMKRTLAVRKASPQTIAQEQFFQAVYGKGPYGKIFPTEQEIEGFTLNMIKDFYEKNFGAKRSVLYVAGKFDQASVNSAANTAFGKWKAGPAVSYPDVKVVAKSDTLFVARPGAPQTTVMIGRPILTPNDKDYVAMRIANSLLGGSFSSRITSNIRENKGYTYSPYSTISNRKGSTLWFEAADVTTEHTVDAIKEIEKEIKRLAQEPPSSKELQGIQTFDAGTFMLTNSSPQGIINQLNFLDLYNLGDAYLTNYVKNVYAVTPAKVSELVKKWIPVDKMTFVLVGDKEAFQKQLQGVN